MADNQRRPPTPLFAFFRSGKARAAVALTDVKDRRLKGLLVNWRVRMQVEVGRLRAASGRVREHTAAASGRTTRANGCKAAADRIITACAPSSFDALITELTEKISGRNEALRTLEQRLKAVTSELGGQSAANLSPDQAVENAGR